MRTLVVRWAVIVIAVFAVAWWLPQMGILPKLISYTDWVTLAIFSAILALLNTFVRPILLFFSIPLTCLTLGLFTFVINAVLFAIAGALTPGFQIANFWGALIGAVAVSVVGVLVSMLVGADR